MPCSECHLRIYGNIVSGAFEILVEGCLDCTFPIHDDGCELTFPEGVPVHRRNQLRTVFDAEIHPFKPAQDNFKILWVVKVLLDVAFEEGIFLCK